MGVYHFMGLGRAIGAVTCVVDYIEKALDKAESNEEIKRFFSGSGGINHTESDRGKIEALVFFTSKDVIRKELEAFKYAGCDKPKSVREEIVKNLHKLWKRTPKSPKIFWCEVDIDDYNDCFKKAISVAHRFSPGKQGKEIWCNMTGGTNTIQLALLTMSRLTAKSTKHYFISQKKDYQQEITVPKGININPNKDGYFNVLPFFKFSLDTQEFYAILEKLEDLDEAVTNQDLLSHLKGDGRFCDYDLPRFIDTYLLRLYGLGYTERPTNDKIKITNDGRIFLQEDLRPLKEWLNFDSTRNIVEESKSWEWFKEEKI